MEAQSCDEGGSLPMPVRSRGDAARAFRCAPTGAGHVRGRTSFIEKHQLGYVKRQLMFSPLGARRLYVFAFLLAGVQGFF